ncbi:hypothetical protein ES705_08985 [subsurface metagenome]
MVIIPSAIVRVTLTGWRRTLSEMPELSSSSFISLLLSSGNCWRNCSIFVFNILYSCFGGNLESVAQTFLSLYLRMVLVTLSGFVKSLYSFVSSQPFQVALRCLPNWSKVLVLIIRLRPGFLINKSSIRERSL